MDRRLITRIIKNIITRERALKSGQIMQNIQDYIITGKNMAKEFSNGQMGLNILEISIITT